MREPRTPTAVLSQKGGEEKSPYALYFNTMIQNILDLKPMITPREDDSLQGCRELFPKVPRVFPRFHINFSQNEQAQKYGNSAKKEQTLVANPQTGPKIVQPIQ